MENMDSRIGGIQMWISLVSHRIVETDYIFMMN